MCSSVDLNRISFVRASNSYFKTVVFDALEVLESKRSGCLLGEPTRRRPVLPSPAPPRRPAVRRPDPTRPWYVRVLDSTGVIYVLLLKHLFVHQCTLPHCKSSIEVIHIHIYISTYVSKSKSGYHGRVEAGWRPWAAGRSRAGQGGTPSGRVAQETTVPLASRIPWLRRQLS